MTQEQQHTTLALADAPIKQRQWTVRIEVLSPHFATLPGADSILNPSTERVRLLASPEPPADLATPGGIDRVVERALACVPGIDMGEDDDGLPIIAAEAVLKVWIVDPDGRECVVPCEGRLRWRKVVGWQALEEFDLRERIGEGVIEERPNQETIDPLKIWVWREAATSEEGEGVPVVIVQGAEEKPQRRQA